MSKKLTITVDDEVYEGLHSRIGRRRISRFLNDLARPHVAQRDITEEYKAMAADQERDSDTMDWVEGSTGTTAP
jgi:predicted CopG family antitoxin